MENGIMERRDAVADAMEDLEHLVKKKTKSHMTVFEDIARLVDVGFSGPEAIQWCRLVYLPLPKILEKDVSSSHHWASGPGTVAFLKTTSKTMPLKEGSSLRNLDAQAKKETEADNSVINMETHE